MLSKRTVRGENQKKMVGGNRALHNAGMKGEGDVTKRFERESREKRSRVILGGKGKK